MGAEHADLRLRLMLESDLPVVLALEQQVYPYPWSLGMFQDCLRGDDYQCQLLQGAEPIGYAICSSVLDEAQILNLCIAPSWQGRGHGRLLLHRVVQGFRDRGMTRLFLEVRQGNQAAQGLYRNSGFRVVGQRRGYYPAGAGREDALVMLLDLP